MTKTEEKSTAEIFYFFISIFVSHFCGSFFPSWIRIQIVNPDPGTDLGTPLNPDPQQ
jgi:hypothetical protein